MLYRSIDGLSGIHTLFECQGPAGLLPSEAGNSRAHACRTAAGRHCAAALRDPPDGEPVARNPMIFNATERNPS